MSMKDKPEKLHFSIGWRTTRPSLYDLIHKQVPAEKELYWYMDCVEDIVKELYNALEFSNDVTIHYDSTAQGYVIANPSKYHIDTGDLKSFKRDMGISIFRRNSDVIYDNLYTLLTHEFYHLKNKDVVYYGICEKEMKHKYMKVLNTLKEIRADLSAKAYLKSKKKPALYRWAQGEGEYIKTGYFNRKLRQKALIEFNKYDEKTVNILFERYIKENKSDIVAYVKATFTDEKLKYFLTLLGV